MSNRYDKPYRVRLLSWFAKDKAFFLENHLSLIPEHFSMATTWAEKALVVKMLEHLAEYKEPPTFPILVNEARGLVGSDEGKKKSMLELLRDIKNTELTDKSYFENTLLQFTRGEAVNKAVLNAVPLFNNGDYDLALRMIDQASRIGSQEETISDYFANCEDRVAEMGDEEDEYWPTLIKGLDMSVGGVRKIQDLSIILAPTNVGKTMMLIIISSGLLFAGARVLYVTLEQGTKDIEKKFDSNFSGVPIGDVSKEKHTVIQRVTAIKRLFSPRLMIHSASAGEFGVDDLRHLIQHTLPVKNGFVPDFIALDYADKMKPVRRRGARHEEQGETMEALYSLTHEINRPLWSAAHTTKEASKKKRPRPEDMGGGYEKAKVADGVFALCQTANEAIKGRMRWFTAKHRFSKKFSTVNMLVDPARVRVLNSSEPTWYGDDDDDDD